MNSNIKQYLDFIYDWERIQTETYLNLLCNAARKKKEAQKQILAKEGDIDANMKAVRKYSRIMNYLIDRWERERKRREFGIA